MADEFLLDLLDRRFALVDRSEGRPFIVECVRLHRWLTSDIRLLPYVRDLRDEMGALETATSKTLHAFVRGARAVLDRAPVETSASSERFTLGALRANIDALDNWLAGSGELDDPRKAASDAARVLSVRLTEAAGAAALDAESPFAALIREADDVAARLRHRLRVLNVEGEASPAPAFSMLEAVGKLALLREVMDDRAERAAEWLDCVEQEPALEQARSWFTSTTKVLDRTDWLKALLRRLHDALHGAIGSTLSHVRLIERFKLRAALFERERLRQLAETSGADKKQRQSERVLVRELAKYLFDEGVLAMTAVPVGNHELDILGHHARPLLVEGKVSRSGRDRAEVIRGVSQLHAYMARLEGTAFGVREAHYVVFRLDGPLFDLPRPFSTNRYRIHTHVVDLGESPVSGRHQPKVDTISPDELKAAVDSPTSAPRQPPTDPTRRPRARGGRTRTTGGPNGKTKKKTTARNG